MADYLIEGDRVCLVCLQMYENREDDISPSELLYFQNVCKKTSKYLPSECSEPFRNFSAWDFAESGYSPICSPCFVYMDKIFKIVEMVDKLKIFIRKLVESFTINVQERHDQLQTICSQTYCNINKNGKDSGIKSRPVSLFQNEYEYEDIVVKYEILVEDIQVDKNENYDDHGFDDADFNDPLISRMSMHENDTSSSADKISNINDQEIRVNERGTTHVPATSCSPADSLSDKLSEFSKYQLWGLKPVTVALKRLNLDSQGNILPPSSFTSRKRKAATAALKRLINIEWETNLRANESLLVSPNKRDQNFNSDFENEQNEGLNSEIESDFSDTWDSSQKRSNAKRRKYKRGTSSRLVFEKAHRFKCQDQSCSRTFNFHRDIQSHSAKSGHINKKECIYDYCKRSFYSKKDLKYHSEMKPTKCRQCPKLFQCQEKLRRHFYVRHFKKRFTCKECDEAFFRKTNLKIHINLHRKCYKCQLCSKTFIWRVSLREHNDFEHNSEKYGCKMCSKIFPNKYKLYRHSRTHLKSKITVFHCIACKKVHFNERVWDKCIKSYRRKKVPGFRCIDYKCGLNFSSAKDLKNHDSFAKHNNKRFFKCRFCRTFYYRSVDVKHHRRICPISGHEKRSKRKIKVKAVKIKAVKYKANCSICSKEFPTVAAVNLHLRSHGSDTGKFKCSICGNKYRSKHHRQKHIKDEHEDKMPFKCDTCDRRYERSRHLEKHQKNCKVAQKSVKCLVCKLSFPNRRKFYLHSKTHKGIYACQFCEKQNMSKKTFKEHLLTDHVVNYRCKKCGEKFPTKVELKNHETNKHSEETPFSCFQCGKICKTADALQRHDNQVHNTEGATCGTCGKEYGNREKLSRHIAKVHRKTKISCDKCDKMFSCRSSLNMHVKVVHTKESQYCCPICNRIFGYALHLRLHVLRHEGSELFQCNDCEKKFVSKGNLSQHQKREHSKNKFVCDVCGKCFRCEEYLTSHLVTHGEKNFTCDKCAFTCSRNDNLITHMRCHTQEKPYVCDLCGKSYARKDNLNTHLKKCSKKDIYEERRSDSE